MTQHFFAPLHKSFLINEIFSSITQKDYLRNTPQGKMCRYVKYEEGGTIYMVGDEYASEWANHLGNVWVKVTDKMGYKPAVDLVVYFEGEVNSITDYYPFSSFIESRDLESQSYRFGFNTQEKEISFSPNTYTAIIWEYNGRLAKRFNNKPRPIPESSLYACFSNNPIYFLDSNGDTIRGQDKQSGRKAIMDIRSAFKGRRLKEARQLFKLSSDRKSIGQIDRSAYLSAVTKAMANGQMNDDQSLHGGSGGYPLVPSVYSNTPALLQIDNT